MCPILQDVFNPVFDFWQPGHTDLIVGSLLEVIHTPAKLFA